MDTSNQYDDLKMQLNHFIAENESLKAQLEECLYIINIRNQEIESLKRKINEATESKSNTDGQLEELEVLQYRVGQLKKQIENEIKPGKQLGYAVSTDYQLSGMKQQFTYLQTQLSGLQEQVQELNNRNLLLQQQTSRIAELKSLLEDTERGNDELKNKIAKYEQDNLI